MAEKTELEKAIAFEAIRGRLPDVWTLLEIVESANRPEYQDSDSHMNFRARDGWEVSFFYDCGELDYINDIRSPDGLRLDPWDWPYGAPGGNALRAWGRVGCRARLMELRQRSPVHVIDRTTLPGDLEVSEELRDEICAGRIELRGGWLDWDASIIRRTPRPERQAA